MTKDADSPVNQSKLDVYTCSWREARENECERITIGFAFSSDWIKQLRQLREFCTSIVYLSNAMPKRMRSRKYG